MFLTVKTGLQSVFEAVVANLKEGSVSFNTQVEEIVKEGDNRYLVRLANGEKKKDRITRCLLRHHRKKQVS